MARQFTRKEFIATSLMAGVAVSGLPFTEKQKQLNLSFSTLGCPDWSFDKILDFAVAKGYRGIELRGIMRNLNLLERPEFSSDAAIADTVKKLKQKKISVVDLGSSSAMHHYDEAEIKKSMDEAKGFIRLAQKLNCPYIRVYPNNYPKDKDKAETRKLIAKHLAELGEYAKDYNVIVLMETHGDLTKTAELLEVMEMAANPRVGLVWDMTNMWLQTKEAPEEMYRQLKKYIYHTHIKDLVIVDGKEHYVYLGKGETPILKAVEILKNDNYKGFYSFEWEKLWHPELEEPDMPMEEYVKTMRATSGMK